MEGMLKALITGVAGQDGSFLSELLLSKGYLVVGITRRKNVDHRLENINHLLDHPNFKIVYGDITDATLIYRLLYDYQPHEFYNLAAMSNVGQSFKEPVATFKINAEAVMTQLEAIKNVSPSTRFYQASSSEQFGGLKCPETGYDENSPFYSRSPYATSKLSAYWAVKNYRDAYHLYACNGILHNHSSPRRGLDFATRKITRGVAAIKLGLQDKVKMGNLSAFRDEGHASDYTRAMYLMLQQEKPDDYLVATGSGATIEDMLRYVCELAELKFEDVYQQDLEFMRPSDVPFLLGNPKKAIDKLNWIPSYDWKKLLKEMYDNDLSLLKK
jgi:GDPmannose 4,6-dehydratase